VIRYTDSNEFQKLGLPHMHCSAILSCVEKEYGDLNNTDNKVFPKVWNIKIYPQLFNLVREHVIYGPCGSFDPYFPCIKEDSNGTTTC
jgi:hypothetical protein